MKRKTQNTIFWLFISALLLSCKAATTSVQTLFPGSTPTTGAETVNLDSVFTEIETAWGTKVIQAPDCPQQAGNIQVEPSQSPNGPLLTGCIVTEDGNHPQLSIQNLHPFYLQIEPADHNWDYPTSQLLSPNGMTKFTARTNDPSPLVVTASSNPLVHLHNLVDFLLTVFPGEHVIGSQTEVVKCIAEKNQDIPDLVIAAQALTSHNTSTTAGSILRLLQDPGLGNRWINVVRACSYQPAQSWTIDTVEQTGEALGQNRIRLESVLQALLSPWDSEIRFSWKRPETPAHPSPTEAAATTPTAVALEIGNMGYSTDYYVRYDPSIWEATWAESDGNRKVLTLHHKSLNGCMLSDNLGHGAPSTWAFSQEPRTIGSQNYSIETWTDSITGKIVLRVYGRSDTIRIELAPGDMPQPCIQAAEQVLLQSEKEMLTGPQ